MKDKRGRTVFRVRGSCSEKRRVRDTAGQNVSVLVPRGTTWCVKAEETRAIAISP